MCNDLTYLTYLMCNKDIKGYIFVCMLGVEFLTFNIFLHAKSEQKVGGNWFCAPIIFNNPVEKSHIFLVRYRRTYVLINSIIFISLLMAVDVFELG